jgi:hypothetical protein
MRKDTTLIMNGNKTLHWKRNSKACETKLAIAIYPTKSLPIGSATPKVAPGTAVVLLTMLIFNLKSLTKFQSAQ